ncbi:MAG: hypothetical protein LBU79_07575, partial [Planctomycetota bacterium]|nr:hypothetical protein [Planctomycetota bacterium]
MSGGSLEANLLFGNEGIGTGINNTYNLNSGTHAASSTVYLNQGLINAEVGDSAVVNGTIETNIGTSFWYLQSGTYSNTSNLNTDGNSNNTFYISNGATFGAGSHITTGRTSNAGIATINLGHNSTVPAAFNTTASFNAIITMNSSINTLNFFNGSSFWNDAKAYLNGDGSNSVNVNAGLYLLTGQVDLSAAATTSTNVININSGTMIGFAPALNPLYHQASFIGSDNATTTINVNGPNTVHDPSNTGAALDNAGGNTALIFSHSNPAATSVATNYIFNGGAGYGLSDESQTHASGQVYNIRHDATTARDSVVSADTATYDNGDYYANTLLNLDTVNVNQDTRLTIGDIDRRSNMVLNPNDYRTLDLGDSAEPFNYGIDSNGFGPSDDRSDYFIEDTGVLGQFQAQISTSKLNVTGGNAKMVIHESPDRFGKSVAVLDPLIDFYSDPTRNVVDEMDIEGIPGPATACDDCGFIDLPEFQSIVTIDRTTIHGSTVPAASGYTPAKITVGVNGVLQGFGEIISEDNHAPLRPNIIGDVHLETGGMLRPFDSELFIVNGNALNPLDAADFERNARKLKGLFFKVEAGFDDPVDQTTYYGGGTTTFDRASRFSTRLFAEEDDQSNALDIISDGSDVDTSGNLVGDGTSASVTRYLSDGLESYTFNFLDVLHSSIYSTRPDSDLTKWSGVKQSQKVQYLPVFGFQNEIKSKLDFNIYKGDSTGESTYYFQVAYASGPNPISELAGMPDANHLFNRDIVFSDMLGNWSFEKQDNDRGVVLRYRQLAKHPQDGGIAIDIPERNAIEVAKKLDEIRYPFFTPINMSDRTLDGLFTPDTSLDGAYQTPFDTLDSGADPTATPYYPYAGNPYDSEGFSGDIQAYYYANQARFTNYRTDWVLDIENYFRALQLESTSAANINWAVRLLSAEPYVSQT